MDLVQLFLDNTKLFPFLLIFSIVVTLMVFGLIAKFAKQVFDNKKYKQKNINLLNRSELKFFEALTNSTYSNLYICPKVRISDLVDVDLPEHTSEFFSALNKITSKHVDFVLCNKVDFKPLMAIELDGPTHKYEDRRKRDEFVDRVFNEAGLPIIHIPVANSYDYKMLSKMINSTILVPPRN